MTECALCKRNQADKKGSHIIPFFLMKKVDNLENKKDRDLELGFKLGSGNVNPYFGRSVQIDKLEQVYGDVTDEIIENNINNNIIDNIFCTECEKRLGVIESAYAKTLNKHEDIPYESTPDSVIAILLWLSVFWRVSVAEDFSFKLSVKDENRLRILVNEGIWTVNVEQYVVKYANILENICYRVIRSPQYTEEFPGFVMLSNSHKRPYCILIGEFAVFLYMKKSYLKGITQSFFDLEKILPKVPINTFIKGEYIYPISSYDFKEVMEKTVGLTKDDFLKGFGNKLDGLHLVLGGKGRMNEKIKKEIITAIVENKVPMGKKYTPETTTPIIVSVIQKYMED